LAIRSIQFSNVWLNFSNAFSPSRLPRWHQSRNCTMAVSGRVMRWSSNIRRKASRWSANACRHRRGNLAKHVKHGGGFADTGLAVHPDVDHRSALLNRPQALHDSSSPFLAAKQSLGNVALLVGASSMRRGTDTVSSPGMC
jgi:hypothetical protein